MYLESCSSQQSRWQRAALSPGCQLQELREGIVVELDLSRGGLRPSGAELIGMLLPVNASLTSVR